MKKYTVILQFPDTDAGFELDESFGFWVDDVLPYADIIGYDECQITIESIELKEAWMVEGWVKKNPSVRTQYVELTEIAEVIQKLPDSI